MNHQNLKPNLKQQGIRYSLRTVEEGVHFLRESYYIKGKSYQQMGKSIPLLDVLFWLGELMSMEDEAPAQDPTAWFCSSCREFNPELKTSPKH